MRSRKPGRQETLQGRATSLWILMGCSLIAGCGGNGDGGGGPSATATVTITPAAPQLTALQETVQLSATAQSSGAPVPNPTFTWSSLDAAVATVDGSGLVRALANGTARIVASLASPRGADTVTVTVQQAAASIVVTPAKDTILLGTSRQLAAVAVDQNANPIANPAIVWASSANAVATVNTTGLVTSVSRGTALIRAQSGTAQAEAEIVVRLPVVALTKDTAFSGSRDLESLTIAAGATVTLNGEVSLRIADSLVVAGVMQGNCVGLTMRALGRIRISGTIHTGCTDPAVATPSLRIIGANTLDLDDALIEGAGLVELSNDSTFVLSSLGPPFSSGPLLRGGGRVSLVTPFSCSGQGLRVPTRVSKRGNDGSPKGADGDNGAPTVLVCSGTWSFAGADVNGMQGGRGGAGTATVTERGEGGKGGQGGDLAVVSGLNMDFTLRPPSDAPLEFRRSVFRGGGPGDGGEGFGGPDTKPEAKGGDSQRLGMPILVGGGSIVVNGAGALGVALSYGTSGGHGGSAEATAKAGTDATADAPAGPGSNATATGGAGAGIDLSDSYLFFGHFIRGNVAGTDNVTVGVDQPGNAGLGGFAEAVGAIGGMGGEVFTAGGGGGTLHAEGGPGGSVRAYDARSDTWHGHGGAGGAARIQGGIGGHGWNDCILGKPPGGSGGPGALVEAASGTPGHRGDGVLGPLNDIIVLNAANGGDGGFGDGAAGIAGAPSYGQHAAVGATGSFLPGTMGMPCIFTYLSQFLVATDPSSHELVLHVTGIGTVTVRFHADHTATINIGGVTLTTPPLFAPAAVAATGPRAAANATFPFTASGSGTISARTATATISNGVFQTDANGRPAGMTGTFTFGVGHELPGGNPVSYTFTAATPAPAPRPSRP